MEAVIQERRAEQARTRVQALDEQRWQAQQAAAESEVRRQILAEMPLPVTVGDQRKMAELMAGMPLPLLLVELGLRSASMGKRAEAVKAIDCAAGYLYPTMKAVEMRIEGAGGPQVPQVVIELPPPTADEVEQQHQARPFG